MYQMPPNKDKRRTEETIVRFKSPVDGHIECRKFTTTKDRAEFILHNWKDIIEEDK